VLDATFAKATRLLAGIASPRFRSEPLLALERMLLGGTVRASAAATAASSKPAAHSWLSHLVARPLDGDGGGRRGGSVAPDRRAHCAAAGGVHGRRRRRHCRRGVACAPCARREHAVARLDVVGKCARITAPHTSAPRAMFGDQRPAHSRRRRRRRRASRRISPRCCSHRRSRCSLRHCEPARTTRRATCSSTTAPSSAPTCRSSHTRSSLRCCAPRRATPTRPVPRLAQRLQACVDAVRASAGALANDEVRGALLETELCIDAALCAASGELCQLALERAKQPLARAVAASPGSPHVAALARLLGRLVDLRQRATTASTMTPLLLDLRAFERRVSTSPSTRQQRRCARRRRWRRRAQPTSRSHACTPRCWSICDGDERVEQAPALLETARAFDALRACEAGRRQRAAASDAADSALLRRLFGAHVSPRALFGRRGDAERRRRGAAALLCAADAHAGRAARARRVCAARFRARRSCVGRARHRCGARRRRAARRQSAHKLLALDARKAAAETLRATATTMTEHRRRALQAMLLLSLLRQLRTDCGTAVGATGRSVVARRCRR
jgi:hypothetical protein